MKKNEEKREENGITLELVGKNVNKPFGGLFKGAYRNSDSVGKGNSRSSHRVVLATNP